jgi:hypothetical protein
LHEIGDHVPFRFDEKPVSAFGIEARARCKVENLPYPGELLDQFRIRLRINDDLTDFLSGVVEIVVIEGQLQNITSRKIYKKPAPDDTLANS